jgi:2-keto-4-pentenoate hydratase/2-oxohepta-3-ene-1,7-dioic acid hydratase in catechol pathway
VRLQTFALDGRPQLLVETAEGWAGVDGADLLDLIRAGEDGLRRLAEATPHAGPSPRHRPLPPLGRPGKLLFVGVNYKDHVDELPAGVKAALSFDEPMVFAKLPSAIIGPEAPIVVPAESDGHVDYEGELAVIIGRRAKGLTAETALDHVFGYTIVNDVTDRHVQFDHGQLTIGKGIDTFCPMGPAVVLTDEIPDPSDLAISTRVNGNVRQQSRTSNMIFSVVDILVHLSRVISLEPGDVVSTGTPGGVGAFRSPPEFLQAGDTVTVAVEGIGELSNTVVAAGAEAA